MFNKLFLLSLALILVVGSIIGIGCTPDAAPEPEVPAPEAPEAKPIVLGWLLSLTGPFAAMALDINKPISHQVDYTNENGGIAGHPIELIVSDSESDATKAVMAAKRLITQDDIYILLGDVATGNTIPVGLSAAELKTPHLAHSGAEIFFTKMKEAGEQAVYWNFGGVVMEGLFMEQMTVAGKLTESLGTKIAVLYPDTSFGKAMIGAYKAMAAPPFGLDIIVEKSYPADATSFGPQIAAIKAEPDLEVITFHGADFATALCTTALKNVGITLPIVTYHSAATPAILEIEQVRETYAIDPAVYIIGCAPDCWERLPSDDPRLESLKKWNAMNQEFFGEKLFHVYNAYAYGTFNIITVIWEKLLEEQPDILDEDISTIRAAARDTIETIEPVTMAAGVINYSPEKHGYVTPCTAYMGMRYKYPPTYEYMSGFEAATPPWRQ